MTLRHFQIFVAVCDAMNMTAAADALFMSQSAVSQAIAELEKYYDVRLFERLSRKLYLTQAGNKLLSYARHMIGMNLEIEKDMKALHESGRIRVGASVTIGTAVLPHVVSAFKGKNADADVRVYEDNTQQIERFILDDRIDIGLVEGDVTSPDILAEPFMEDELILICGKTHPFAGRSHVNPHELEKEDFIIRENGSGTRKTFENVMTANGLSWKVTWTCNNADTIRTAVAEGLGVSVISGRVVREDVAAGILCAVPVDGLAFERTFKLIYHKNKYLTESMKRFMALCRA